MQIIQRVKQWTPEEDKYLTENYLSMSDEEIGNKIGRSKGAVKSERSKLKLFRTVDRKKNRTKRPDVSFENIIDIFKSKGYDLISSVNDYKNKSSILQYICRKHRDKGIQKISVSHLLEGKGCYYCGRERTAQSRKSKVTQEDDKKLCELKGFEYIETKYENGIYFIYFICKNHKELGIQKMRRGNMNRKSVNGCQYCMGMNLPHWYIKNSIETSYGNLSVLSEYQGMNKQLTCYCKTHDIIFTNVAKEIFHHGRGCNGCTHDKQSENKKLSEAEIIDRAVSYNPNISIIDISNYENYYSKIHVKCNKCNYDWYASLSDLRNQNGHCPNCYIRLNTSLGELSVLNYLKEKNILYCSQYIIDECKNIKPLPFDFAILDSNMKLLGLIEYQGEQHYKPIDYFGGQQKFEIRIKCDNIKKEYCDSQNIPLLVIPYWEYDNISTIVDDFIMKLN